ncbi:MAG: type VI secretion system protein TssA [Desulfovibrio sp.]|jgi:type VI secretion system protein VasJ|nr:type VI secretion system protein TssA [Desulfovibrio sp.]
MEEEMGDLSSYATLGARPIPGDNPAGKDARYEPEYAAVLAEIEKLSFSGSGQTVSWLNVEKNAAAILAGQSKDLQIAAYLGVALWQNNGPQGLSAGISILADLLGTYWETAWPALKRMRGRINAVNWWHERTSDFLKDCAGQSGLISAELGKQITDELGRLDGLITSLMPDASPLRDMANAVRQLSAPQPEADPAPAPAPAAEQTAAAGAAGQGTPPPAAARPDPAALSAEDPALLRRNFNAAALAYLHAARRGQPADAALWQMSRLVVWGTVTSMPDSDDGRTQLPAPDMGALAEARVNLDAGKALEAALAAEAFFSTAPFCLDAQEIVYSALASLGPQFADAAQSVLDAAAAFIRRFPGVEKLSFSDGTPFAAPKTIVRLREAAASQKKTGTDEERTAGSRDYASLYASAKDLLARNKVTEAIASLDAAKGQSPAVNLRLTACQVRLLCAAGNAEAAGLLAETVLGETAARDLDTWDPEAALDALLAVRDAFSLNVTGARAAPELLVNGSNTSASGPLYAEMLRDVRRRIARLHPASILE